MKRSLVIIKKEIADALRDGKSMATAFFLPCILAIVSFGTTSFLVSLQTSSEEITLPVQGAEFAQPLIDRLRETGIRIVDAPGNYEQAVIERRYDMVLVIPDELPQQFREQKTATIMLFSDQSRTESQTKVQRVRNILNQWSTHIGALRLITRNVSPAIANPLRVTDVNVTTDERLASRVLSGLPMFVLLIAFASGIGMISDMASGERERRSLEPLLINPVSVTEVFFGKWAAAVVVTFTITLLGIALQFISIALSPLPELGLRLTLGVTQFFLIMAILIPVVFFAVSLQLLVSFFAKSFKDAQSYNSLIVMLPMVPGLYLTFNSGSAELWQMFIPLLGTTALIVDIVGADSVLLSYVVVSTLTLFAFGLLAAWAGVRLLKQERTVLG